MKYVTPVDDQARDMVAFTHHRPFGDQTERYESNRRACLGLVALFRQNCPPSPELETAILHIRVGMMVANAAIACNEVESSAPSTVAPPKVVLVRGSLEQVAQAATLSPPPPPE